MNPEKGNGKVRTSTKMFFSGVLVLTVCDQRNCHALGNPKRQHTKQTLGINSTLFLFNPDRALVAICFLNKEGRRSCMQTDTIGNLNFA